MSENFNNNYRIFAEAAKSISSREKIRQGKGLGGKSFRKESFKDPNALRDNTSSEFKKYITKDSMVDFFKALSGTKYVNARRLRSIASFLYEHRTTVIEGGKSNLPLSENDRQLMNLACSLLENSLYRGDLLGLPDEQGASLAFTANVISKYFENNNSKEGLKGFDDGKLLGFLDEVRDFARQSCSLARNPSEQRQKTKRLEHVINGREHFIRLMRNGSSVVYLIKNVLMLDNFIRSQGAKKVAAVEEDLCDMKIGGEKARIGSRPSYHMLTHRREAAGKEGHSNYANLHYYPENLPFVVWVIRYLRFKKSVSDAKQKTQG